MRDNTPLPNRFLNYRSKIIPDLWRKLDEYRFDHGRDAWPANVFMPVNEWHRFLTTDIDPEASSEKIYHFTAHTSAAAAWRPTQDIINFDSDLYREIIKTPMTGKMPADALTHLPAWAVYFNAPGISLNGITFDGFFAEMQLAGDRQTFILHLYFINNDFVTYSFIVPLGDWSLGKAVEMVMESEKIALKNLGKELTWEYMHKDEPGLHEAMNLILYVCSYGFMDKEGAGLRGWVNYPGGRRTKSGWRLFPPPKPRIRHLGQEFGELIRKSRVETARHAKAGHPRPHMRRAHWHGYWFGSKKEDNRHFNIRWLPPIPVGKLYEDEGETMRAEFNADRNMEP